MPRPGAVVAGASSRKAATGEPRFLRMRPGRRRNFWWKNCIALGPAAVSIEPLEATDTLMLQKALELLVAYFPDKTFSDALSVAYNQRMTDLSDKVRDFILLHYLLNERAEGPFWRDSKNVAVPESLRDLMDLHAENGIVPPDSVFPESSYHHLFAAAERLPRRPVAAAAALDFAQVIDIMQKMRVQNEQWLAKLPSHRELMEAIHRPTV